MGSAVGNGRRSFWRTGAAVGFGGLLSAVGRVDSASMNNTHPAGTPGKRWLVAGCVTLMLFSAVHMIPMFADLFVEPTKPVEVEAKRAMAAVAVDMGPFHTNWLGLNRLLSASYSTLLFFVVALNLVALPAVAAGGRLRALAVVNAVFVCVLLAIAAMYRFPPPGVFSVVALAFFIAAVLKAKPRAAAA